MIRRVTGVLMIVFACTLGIQGQHPDRKNLVPGRPETRLAHIQVNERTRMKTIAKLYGEPTSIKAWESENPPSTYEYDWDRPGLKLHIMFQRSLKKDHEWELVEVIEVKPGTSPRIGVTGRGLKIGDSLHSFKRIYGPHVKVFADRKSKTRSVGIQWQRGEYTLSADLDRRNRITSLTFYAPE